MTEMKHAAIEMPDVLSVMETQGGSFVSALSIAWRRADYENAARLMKAFGDIYARHERIAIAKAEELQRG